MNPKCARCKRRLRWVENNHPYNGNGYYATCPCMRISKTYDWDGPEDWDEDDVQVAGMGPGEWDGD